MIIYDFKKQGKEYLIDFLKVEEEKQMKEEVMEGQVLAPKPKSFWLEL